jgi:hypothetical protein
MTARVAAGGLVCAVLLGLVAGCASEGGDGEGRPTRSASFSPTREPPSPTRTRTDEPNEEPTDRDTDRLTDRPSEEPQETEPEAAGPTEAPTDSQTESAASDEGSTGDDVPSWVWWLLAAVVVVAGALTWVFVARSRRQRDWQEQLQAAETEVAWLARELLPQLRDTGSLDRVAGGWQVALPRVASAEDRLTVLESTAKDEAAGARARQLRDAVRDARTRMQGLTARGPQDMWALDLDEAIMRLESALAHGMAGQA